MEVVTEEEEGVEVDLVAGEVAVEALETEEVPEVDLVEIEVVVAEEALETVDVVDVELHVVVEEEVEVVEVEWEEERRFLWNPIVIQECLLPEEKKMP